MNTGSEMHELAQRLFPICRSITGNGVRETLKILQEYIPIAIHEVPSGTQVFDWNVPKEWNIREAYIIEDSTGKRVVDFKNNNLHIVGYSVPIDAQMSLKELQEHLYSLEDQPEAIPYVTSYYREHWGFCMAHRDRLALKEGMYRVHIDSDLKEGSLTYGELLIPGASKKEVFLSTYICHPSMANNEISGPVVATYLAMWLLKQKLKYSYRIIFIPETIGSLTYLSQNLDEMQRNIVAGFNLTCMGDDRVYSYVPSRTGATLTDKVALRVLSRVHPNFMRYSFLDRGSDERQYCAPGVDLPVVTLARSKFGAYPEYHTSLDDLKLVTPTGLQGGFDLVSQCLQILEQGHLYKAVHKGEAQLGKRGLFPTLSHKGSAGQSALTLLNVLAYADGSNDEQAIADILGISLEQLLPAIKALYDAGLIVEE